MAAAPSLICDELPAVTTPSGLNAGFRLASFSSDESGLMPSFGPDALVAREERGAFLARDLHRDDLLLEAPLVGGTRSAQVRLEREAVVVLSRDVPLLGDELGRDPLRDEAAPLLVAREHLGTERLAAGSERRAHRHPAHALDAGGDHDVVRAGDDALGREVRGLLGRAALTVDGRADCRFREPGSEGSVAANVHGLVPHLHNAAHDHVLDQFRVEARALDQSVQRERGEVDGMDVLERAVPPPLGGADGVDDDGRGHGSLLG